MSRDRNESVNNSISTENDDFVVIQPSDSDDLSGSPPLDANQSPKGTRTELPNDSSDEFSSPVAANHEGPQGDIEFLNVQRVYPTDQDIRIRCAMTKSFKFSEMDSIGLYRLGWSDPTEAVASEYVQHVQRVEQFFTVLKSCFLPTNPTYDEYYQFCYVLHDGKAVKGASAPFHLIRSIKSDGSSLLQASARLELTSPDSPSGSFVAVEKPRKSVENVETCSKCTELNSYKNRLDAALQSKALATSELVALEERYDHLNNVFQAQTVEARKLKRSMEDAVRKNSYLEKEKEQQAKTMEDIMSTFTDITKELESTRSEMLKIREEKDNVLTQLLVIQADRDKMNIESEAMEQQIVILNEEMSDMSMQVADKENWISSISGEIERLSGAKKELLEENEKLKDNLKTLEEHEKDVLGHITTIQTDHQCLTDEKQTLLRQMEVLEKEVRDISEEFTASRLEVQKLEGELDATVEQHSNELERMRKEMDQKQKSLDEMNEAQVLMESYTTVQDKSLPQFIQELMEENRALFKEGTCLREKLQEVVSEQDKHQREKCNLKSEIEHLRTRNVQLKLASENVSRSGRDMEKSDIKDTDVLVRYLPTLSQHLLNIKTTAPTNFKEVIGEMNEMLRFLLTSNKRLTAEIKRLRENTSET